jgi:hypothetical protein
MVCEFHVRDANMKRAEAENIEARKTVHRYIWGIGDKVEGRGTHVSKAMIGILRAQELTVKRALLKAKKTKPS